MKWYMDKVNYNERFKQFRKKINLSQKALSEKLKFTSHVSITNIEKGKAQLSSEKLIRLKELYPHFNIHWLLTGEGEMFLDIPIQDLKIEFYSNIQWLKDFTEKILAKKIELSKDTARQIDTIAKALKLLWDDTEKQKKSSGE